jgi:hypothetical protein
MGMISPKVLEMYPESYISEPTKKTPWVILEPGKIFIMGRSIPENPGEFYRPVLEWMTMCSLEHTGMTKILFGFEYVNTSSTKWLYTVLRELSSMKGACVNVKFTWYFEKGDEDMSELGEILRTIVDCPFEIVEVTGMDLVLYDKILSGNFKGS